MLAQLKCCPSDCCGFLPQYKAKNHHPFKQHENLSRFNNANHLTTFSPGIPGFWHSRKYLLTQMIKDTTQGTSAPCWRPSPSRTTCIVTPLNWKLSSSQKKMTKTRRYPTGCDMSESVIWLSLLECAEKVWWSKDGCWHDGVNCLKQCLGWL